MNTVTQDLLGRSVEDGGSYRAVLLSRLTSGGFADCSTASTYSGGAVSMQNLWRIKEEPWTPGDNLMTDNVETCATELAYLDHSGCWIVQDATGVANTGPGAASTVAHSSQKSGYILRGYKVQVTCVNGAHSTAVLDATVKSMRENLLIGTSTISEAAAKSLNITAQKVKANVIICDFGLPFMPPKLALTPEDRITLQACGTVHAQLASDPLYQVQGKARLPPIIIHSPPFSTVYEEVLNVLATAGADLNKVLFTQIALYATNTEQWSQLLSRYPCSICVDTWGYSATFSPTCYPPGTASAEAIPRPFPPDVHLAQSVAMLCHAGHAAQVLLSLAIYCKLQWTSYGGYGYGYLHRRVIPLVRRCLLDNRVGASGSEHGGQDDNMKQSNTSATSTSAEGHSTTPSPAAVGASDVEATLSALARDNALRLILWRPPPAQANIEVQRLTCHVCKRLFIPGNHFSKFEFDYCSSGCLSEHRKANWK